MDIIFYGIAILIFLVPFYVKGFHFLDIMPLFLFYFDATDVFVRHAPSYHYFENALILFFSIYVFSRNKNGRRFRDFGVFSFLLLGMIVFQLLQSVTLNQTFRNFSLVYASMIILPLSFNHYSKSGNLNKLWFSTFLLIVFYVLFVFYATPLRLGSFESERIAGTTFYFGHIAIRGGITYISFVLLVVPLIMVSLRHWQRIVLIIAIAFIFVFFLSALKRFVFVVLGLGLLNYLLRPVLKRKTKIRIGLIFAILAVLVVSIKPVQKIVKNRYEERGAEFKFSEEVIESDVRIYEPLYILKAVMRKPIHQILFGEKARTYTFKHEDIVFKERYIHNYYALLLSSIGFIGLLLYLFVYYKLYKYVRKVYQVLKKKSGKWAPYWISFQNMVLIFIIQGMVGGHGHVSLRGLVFLYAGALGGYLYYVFENRQ